MPNNKSSPNAAFSYLLATHPFSARRCSEQLRPVQTNSNVSFPCSRKYLTSGYTSPWFCNPGPTCAITTALHSPTYINRRLLAASKVESLSLSNPLILNLYWLERQSVCRYTPPFGSTLTEVFLSPWTIALKRAPTTTFWSGTIRFFFAFNHQMYIIIYFKSLLYICYQVKLTLFLK